MFARIVTEIIEQSGHFVIRNFLIAVLPIFCIYGIFETVKYADCKTSWTHKERSIKHVILSKRISCKNILFLILHS